MYYYSLKLVVIQITIKKINNKINNKIYIKY